MSVEEEVRALKGQLESLQKAYDISEEVVRDLTAEVRRIREAGKMLAEKHSRVCNQLREMTKAAKPPGIRASCSCPTCSSYRTEAK
jgi:hypothetical protein